MPTSPLPGSAAPAGGRLLGLDAIRAVAILLVLLSHCSDIFAAYFGRRGPPWLSVSGLFGVELFFVLSGFLIGGILLRLIERQPGWRDWLVFMVRRWMRTLPLYAVWLVVLALVLPPAVDPAWHYLHYATLTQNLFWPPPADNWFGVSWSLTVEEWFYLSFSAALLGATALTRRAAVPWMVIGAFLVLPLVARVLRPAGADWMLTTYKVAALRLDAIAYGVALARLARRDPWPFRHPMLCLAGGVSLLGLLWLQASVGLLSLPTPLFVGVLPTATSAGCALLFPAALRLRHRTGLGSALLRQLSAQSYSLYLVHLSILEWLWYPILLHGLPRVAAPFCALGLIFGVSYLAWKFIEQPILIRRPVALRIRSTIRG